MSRLSICLLGPFQTYLEGKPLENFKSDKARALLAYLAVEAGQLHSRHKMAGLLWPEMADAEALANLRFTLSSLRKTLRDRDTHQPILNVGRETLQLNPLSDVWVDVSFFERQVVYAADLNPLQAMSYMTAAVQSFQSDFLEGFYLAGCRDFEDWLLLKRERLNTQAIGLLYKLATFYEDCGQWEHALAYTQRALDLASWDERLHQKAMRLLVQMENPSAALAQYQACKRLLASKMQLSPSPTTETLAAQIRDGKLSPRPTSVPTSPNTGERVCVGRATELRQLQDGLQAALAGEGQTVFVSGEAGSGKTTLLDYFVSQTLRAQPDLLAAWGECSALSDAFSLPFQPFRDMLESLTGEFATRRVTSLFTPDYAQRVWNALPRICQTLVESGPDLVGTLLPAADLQRRIEAFTPPGAPWRLYLEEIVTQHEAQALISQEHLLAQITHLLQSLSDLHPLVLIFDDLQWADPASLNLLYHLGQRLKNHRVLLLGAYRPADHRGTQSLSLLRVVRELQRRTGRAPLDLDRSDGRVFVEAWLAAQDYRVGEDFRANLYRQTGGQALFTVDTLRAMQDSEKLIQDRCGHWVVSPTLNWQSIPARVDAILAEAFERFSGEVRTLLEAASLLDDVSAAPVVAQVTGFDEADVKELFAGLPGGEMAWLLPQRPSVSHTTTPHGARPAMYRFRHQLYQEFIARQIPLPERNRLHGEIAQALAGIHRADPKAVAAQIAYHFEQAGQPDAALPYFLHAAQYASSRSAYEQAITLLTRALELLAVLPSSPERDAHELQLLNALSGQLLGGVGWGSEERLHVTQRAYELCQQAGEATASQFLLTLFALADMARARGEHTQSLLLGEQMMDLARGSRDREYLALAHWTLGATQFFRGELGEAREHLESVLTLHVPSKESAITAITGTDAAVVSLSWLSWMYALEDEPDAAQQAGARAVALADQLEHPFNQVFARTFGECGLYALNGDWRGVLTSLEGILPLVKQDDLAPMKPWALVFRGWAQTSAGNCEEGIEQIRTGIAAWQAAGAISGLTCMEYYLAKACLHAGRQKEAQNAMDEAQALMTKTGELLFQPHLSRLKEKLSHSL